MNDIMGFLLAVFIAMMSACIGVCLIIWFIYYMDNVVYPSTNETCQSHLIKGSQNAITKK